MKIIKVPSDLPIHYAIQAEELVDNTFGEGMFFKQTWDSSIHQWFYSCTKLSMFALAMVHDSLWVIVLFKLNKKDC